jgi:hypothetical protein
VGSWPVRNLRPIYTPTMLRENAGVFTNWPMFRDHAIIVAESEEARAVREAETDAREEMVEAICESWMATRDRLEEAVKKVGRSIDDLAGRITRSWWDPDLLYEDDADFGYQPGGVVGLSLLLPSVREMVAADPQVAHTSINGYPTGGKPGPVPWAPSVRGMVIEGIRKVPMGSVDVVVRGGAGGRFLRSPKKKKAAPAKPGGGYVREREVSSVHSGYGSGQMADITLTEATTPDQLRAWVAEHAPQLSSALSESQAPSAAAQAAAASAAAVPVTRADIDAALREARESFTQEIGTVRSAHREELKTEITAGGTASNQARVFEQEAHRMIDAAAKDRGGFLPSRWVADLKARYRIRPDGVPAPALLAEAEETGGVVTKDALTVLKETVTADLNYARDLLTEAVGGPVVSAQGGGGNPTEPVTEAAKPAGWQTQLADLGVLERDDKGAVKLDGLYESMVS